MINLERDQRLHLVAGLESLHNRFESAGAFRMLLAGMVLEIIGVIHQAYLHNVLLVEKTQP